MARKMAGSRGNVDYMRDRVVPVVMKAQLEALTAEHMDRRRELDILRQTRGHREVGTVNVPAHLREELHVGGYEEDPNSDAGVKVRHVLPPGRLDD